MLLLGLLLSGCGGSSPTNTTQTPPITVGVNSSSQAINAGQTANVTVTTNDPKGVTWSLSGQGSLSGATSTTVTYNAPANVTSAFVATVKATSVSSPTISTSVAINVASSTVSGSAISIGSDSLPNGTATALYAHAPFLSGGVAPYIFSVSAGSLPPGLSILGNNNGTPYPDGTIYGTPTTAGTYYFTFKVSDSATTPDVATQSLTITINPAGTLTISPSTLNNGEIGAYYQQQPLISGGIVNAAYSGSITAGALPAGLALGNSYTIMGTPTTAGTYNFTFQAVDSANPPNVANANYAINILPASTFAILSTALPNGEVGVSYSQQPIASGGIQPYTFSISSGALPPGVTLNTSTGALSGSPTTAGTYNFNYQATDFSIPPKTSTAALSIKIIPALTIAAPASLPNASIGTIYISPPVQVNGGVPPYSFSSSVFSQQTNSITGTFSYLPSTVGVQSVTLSVTDSLGGAASSTLNLTVDPANCPNNSKFQGNYAMLFNGPPVIVPHAVVQTLFVGSFVADGSGNISQGYMDTGGAVTTTGLTGTYCIGPANQGTLSYPLTNPSVYLMNLDSSGNANFMVYQNPPLAYMVPFGFGSLAKQDPAAFIASDFVGQYSFGLSGFDSLPVEVLQAGTFSSDGAGNLNNGEIDLQGSGAAGGLLTPLTFTASDFAIASFGRGTVTLNESGGASASDIFYVVNSSTLFALATTSAPAYSVGPIIQSTGGPYTNASLNGTSVFGLQGYFGPIKSQVGLITWDGNGNFTLTADQNQSGNSAAGTLTTVSYSGTYNVDSDGRVTLISSGESTPPVLYLTGPNQGFMLGAGINFTNGQFFQQSGGPFQSGSFSGIYLGSMLNTFADFFTPTSTIESELDNFSADGVGTLTGTTNLDGLPDGPSSVSVSSTYTVDSSGRGIVSSSGTPTHIFYIVSPMQVLMMPNTPDPKVLSVTQP